MELPSLKHRKPKVYIFLGLFISTIIFVLVESCLPSSISGAQSNFFARIYAFFINSATGPQETEIIKPKEISAVRDSSYLGKDENGNSKIAIGTTTLLSIDVQYPEKKNKDDTLDRTYTIENVLGNKDDYNLVLSSSLNKLTNTINIRIVTDKYLGEQVSDLYKFNVKISDNLTYPFSFRIVDLEKPTSFLATIDKTTLKIGETAQINTQLTGEDRVDTYLRRYFDTTKIESSSSNNEVATIDKYGVVHAVSEGNATITFGTYSFDIYVGNETITNPVDNTIALTTSKSQISALDYDYVFENGEDSNNYSTLIYPSFSDTSLEDQSVSYYLDSKLKAKIAPYKYDELGYPVYKDDNGNNCVRLCGYREKGTVKLTCISNANNNIKSSIDIQVGEAVAEQMNVNLSDNFELILGDQKVITASFSPKNTKNTAIKVVCNDESALQISNNNTASVTISAKKEGSFSITVSSISNPELSKTINFEIIAKQTINPNNFADFATFVRKYGGHMIIYLIMAVFGFLFFYSYFEIEKQKYMLGLPASLTIGFIIAGLTELIQHFVPSRGGEWKDVGIDYMGFAIGTAIALIIYLIVYFIKKAINKKRNSD